MKLHIDSAVMLYFQELHIELNLRVSYLNNASFYDWPLDYHKSKNSKKISTRRNLTLSCEDRTHQRRKDTYQLVPFAGFYRLV